MSTQVKIQNQKTTQPNANGAASDTPLILKAGNDQMKTFVPDYSSMMAEIQKVSDPVSFEDLKTFYGLN